MHHLPLGNTDITVSPLCLDGMQFGRETPGFHQWVLDADTTTSIIGRALDQGINFIDTANTYSAGSSEEFIGHALRTLGARREDVVLASKVFFNEGNLSATAIAREIEGTLRRLGTDYLDLYLIHRFDYEHPIEETLEALHQLVTAGKVRALGASEMYAYQLHNYQHAAETHGWTPFSVLQPHYNLIYREDERELLPLARQYGMAITPYSPLAAGHLTRPTWEGTSHRATTDPLAKDKYDAYQDNNMAIIERLATVADNHNAPMADIALAWLWAKGVTAPIVGATSPERIDSAVRALDITLSAEEVAYLDEPYTAHELVGPAARPGEAALAGASTQVRGQESK